MLWWLVRRRMAGMELQHGEALHATTPVSFFLMYAFPSASADGYHRYLNHTANKSYTLSKSVNKGTLAMPVLFIHTAYDAVCQTVDNPLFMKDMREKTQNLSEMVVKAGHWGNLECPEEVSLGIVEFVAMKVREAWPGAEVKSRL
jgi:pimeloyl-ACP methyl ester carboxylesterase